MKTTVSPSVRTSYHQTELKRGKFTETERGSYSLRGT